MAEVVSADSGSKIDYRIILVIIAGVIAFQIYLNSLSDDVLVENSIIVVSAISELSVAFAALFIAKRYWNSHVFGRSYLFLSAAFFSVFVGEVIYNTYLFVFEIDPFPSIADFFFFLLYPFALIHLIINIKFFQPKLSTVDKIWPIILGFTITAFYSFYSFPELGEFLVDLYYGIIFVTGASAIMAVSLLGVKILKGVPLGRAWLILMIGIMLGTIGDVWYQYLEISESFNTSHIVNLFWYASYWVIVYALYKHGKIF